MGGFLQDLRFAFRSLRRAPLLALTAVLAMGLGIGLTTTIYGVVDAAMLRGLPFPDGDRVVSLLRSTPTSGPPHGGVPAREFLALRERQRELEGLAAYSEQLANLSGDERPQRVDAARVTAGGFSLLRVRPALGREIVAEDDAPGAALVAVISDDLWRTRFQRDPAVLGRVIRVDGEAATVVGVMPPGFRFPVTSDLWIPMRLDPAAYATDAGEWIEVFGRLRPGQTASAVGPALSSLQAAMAREWPGAEKGVRVEAVPYTKAFMGGEDGKQLWVMLAAVMLVLVIACVNVANLLLSRAAQRAKEIAVRAALGATRARVIALFLAESLALALVGALVGIAVAWVGMRLFTIAIADTRPPFWIHLQLDGRVLAFVAIATGTAAVVAGCLPALQASRSDVGEGLKDEGRGTSGFRVGRMSRVLVVLEVALSCGLLMAAGLMVKTMSRLRTHDFGVDTRGTFTARVLLPSKAYGDRAAAQFQDELLARLRGAGVPRPAVASALPVVDGFTPQQVRAEGETFPAGQEPMAIRVAVSPGYFDAVGAHAVQGRDFDDRDRAGAPGVVLVNATFARRRFGATNPVGRRVELRLSADSTRWLTVVGVAPDMLHGGTGARVVQEAMYVPLAQWPERYLAVTARGAADPLSLARPVRQAVASIDADLALSNVGTLATIIEQRTWFYRVFGGTFSIFGLAALFLAALGLYAVMASSVARRTREMGVRMALGADTGRVVRLVLRQGAAQVAVGGALGLGLGFGLSQLLRGLLFDVQPGDPAVTVAIVALLAATGLLASLVPALRASRVDPMAALRSE